MNYVSKKGFFNNFLQKFPVSISDHQLILYLNELTSFQDSHKYIKKNEIENLKNLEEIIKNNFELQENSHLEKPLALIIYCLSIPMLFLIVLNRLINI